MCECYQVGGRFIAEDPDCPVHGFAAQLTETLRDAEMRNLHDRIADLEYTVRELQERVSLLRN